MTSPTATPILTIVADFMVNPDKVEFVQSELRKLLVPTRAEEGCLLYELHGDNTKPNHFLMYETWSTRDLWQSHMGSDHLKSFISATEGCLESLEIHEMTKIDA
jgi:quinol monooxygenase YgiN